jgi:acetyl esterase/lipase
MDARALEYKIAPDVTVEPVTASGVRAEWTSTPNDVRDAALIWLHGGGYVIGSLVFSRTALKETSR